MQVERRKRIILYKNFYIVLLLSLIIIIFNFLGLYTLPKQFFASTIYPFKIELLEFSYDTKLFWIEIFDYDDLVRENLRLRQEILAIRKVTPSIQEESLNNCLDKQKLMITGVGDFDITGYIIGIPLVFDRSVYYYNQPVFFGNILFGFIEEINEDYRTIKVRSVFRYEEKNVSVKLKESEEIFGFLKYDTETKRPFVRGIRKNTNLSAGDIWVTTNLVQGIQSGLIVGSTSNIKQQLEAYDEYYIDVGYDIRLIDHLCVKS
ncbi:MAG: hypothetical protein N3A71_03835 [Candidatus Dojkabacteria bacterium]|nr:hypothetical protein [Candidatus Dojkabacteria bacterium]